MLRSELYFPTHTAHEIPSAAKVKNSSRASTANSLATSRASSILPTTLHISTSSKRNLIGLKKTKPVDDAYDENPEYRLPSIKSLAVVLAGNALFQLSFYIIVPSANLYVEHLGGTSTFSGLVIGVPTVLCGIALLVVKKFDGGQYRRPLVIAYISALIGNILYALAYALNFLYLLLIARMVVGIGFTSFMFSRKYCTDPRLVGIRRRTTLASWHVLGQAFVGVGPCIGGVLYKIGTEKSAWFNGYTAPGWIVAGVWLVFWIVSGLVFEDVSKPFKNGETAQRRLAIGELEMNSLSGSASDIANEPPPSYSSLTFHQKCVFVCMCYYSIAYFFALSCWECNIPVLTAHALGYSPYQAGNFMAIGGAATFPFLFLNVRYSYRVQDRIILITGTLVGLLGLIIFLSISLTNTIHFWSLFVAWFLVALGFHLASTCTLSLLSKQMPGNWNEKVSMAIQYSNYLGRVAGAILGGAGVKVGMVKFAGVQIVVIGVGILMHLFLWRELKTKSG